MKKLIGKIIIAVIILAAVVGIIMMNRQSGTNEDNTLVVGLDDSFPPMGFRDENNELVGFDIDLAKAVCAKLGIEAKFQIINWNSKVFELNSGAIDVIWNGMTITDEIKESTSVTIAYLKNKQVAVVRVEDEAKYKSLDDMKDATICVEAGSAGQLCVVKEE